MVTERTKLTWEERKKLHAKLARGPHVVEKVAEARADYEKARASGELRRKSPPQGDAGTREG